MSDMPMWVAILLLAVPTVIWFLGAVRREVMRTSVSAPRRAEQTGLDVPTFDLVMSLAMLFGGVSMMVAHPPLAGVLITLSGLALTFNARNLRLQSGALQIGFLVLMAVLCGVCTFALFGSFSLLTVTLGILTAVSCGQVLGILLRRVIGG